MPPWPPGPLSPKMLHDRSLTDAQIATFAAWAEGGAPLGDAAHPAPPGQPDFEDIGVPDFTADMGVDYVPDTALTDDYHCFLIDLQRQDDRMIVGYRITPGNGRTVHHVITSLFAASDRADARGAGRRVARARRLAVRGRTGPGGQRRQAGRLRWARGCRASRRC